MQCQEGTAPISSQRSRSRPLSGKTVALEVGLPQYNEDTVKGHEALRPAST